MSAELLRSRREALGLTQAQLADRIGASKFAVSRYETGAVLPTLVVAASIERELGIAASSWVPTREAAQ